MKYFLPLFCLCLSSCAASPPAQTGSLGILPSPAKFRILSGGEGTETLEAALRSKLETMGFSMDERAKLIVQISLSELPPTIGALAASTPGTPWLIAPEPSKSKHARRLLVTVTDSETGEELYRAYRNERFSARTSGEKIGMDDLVSDLFSE